MAEFVNSHTIKRPGQDIPLTPAEESEWVKCANDIEYFVENYFYLQNQLHGRMKMSLRNYQSRYIKTIEENKYSLACWPRQTGKSQSTAAYILWTTIFQSDMKVGVTSKKESDAIEILNRVKYGYEGLPFFLKPEVVEYNKKTIKFVSASSIEAQATTEGTFRSRSLDLVFCDELAFVSPFISDAFMASILPTLKGAGKESKAKLVIASTPNGTEGKFAEYWFSALEGNSNFKIAHIDIEKDLPERDEEFKQEMLKEISWREYCREYLCHFISDKGTLIDPFKLEELKATQPMYELSNGEYHQFLDINGKSLGIAIDVGEGANQDYHAIQVFDISTLEQIAEFKNNNLSQTLFVQEVIRMFRYFWNSGAKEIYYSVENNGVGIGVINLLVNSESEWMDRAIFVHESLDKLGMTMSSKSKAKGTSLLKDLVETKRLTINSQRLISELKFFVKQGQTYKAEKGKNDDLVMSAVLLCLLLEKLTDYEEDLWERLNDVSIETIGVDKEEAYGIVF